MASEPISFPRLPFSKYDIVVYLGVGIFALRFVDRYTLKTWKFPAFGPELFTANSAEATYLQPVLTVLSFIFAVYILGHGVSYASKLLIQPLSHWVFGSPYELISCQKTRGLTAKDGYGANTTKRQQILTCILKTACFTASLPVILLLYVLVQPFKSADLIKSRIPEKTVDWIVPKLEALFSIEGMKSCDIPKWGVAIEYHCYQNLPSAANQMYNYLLISGLLRSVSFMFLMSIWCEIAGKLIPRYALSTNLRNWGALLAVYVAFFVSFFAYAKFYRRHAEEAVMGVAVAGGAS